MNFQTFYIVKTKDGNESLSHENKKDKQVISGTDA